MSGRNLIWMITILALAGLALYMSREKPQRPLTTDPALVELSAPIQAYRLVNQNAYPDPGPDKARLGLIKGLLGEVDEYSTYVPADKVGLVTGRIDGTMEETGLRVTRQDGRLMILGSLPGSPAHQAGLCAGLEIVALDDIDVPDLSAEQVRKLLKPAGDEVVSLTVEDATANQRTVDLASGRFDCQTVTGLNRDAAGKWECDLGGGIYYLRIREFTRRTPIELHELYRTFDQPTAIVLDLRDNPGGTLTAACEVAERFLSSGLIVRTVGRSGEQNVVYAHSDMTYTPMPMVVLVNGKTASAAEIVAGSLQAHRRALLLGERTYGKWKVQSLLPLGKGAGYLYLTTAEYFLYQPPTTQPALPSASRPATSMSATSRAARHWSTSATAPAATPRAGLEPHLFVSIDPNSLQRLEVLRDMASVMPPPEPTTAPTTMPASDLRRMIFRLDTQLASGVKLLRDERVPTTLPARGSVLHDAEAALP